MAKQAALHGESFGVPNLEDIPLKTGLNLLRLAWLVLAASLLQACQKPAPVEEPTTETAPPSPTTAPATASSAPPVVAVAAPPPDPIAPAGIFFLTQKVSITTDDGIFGLKPGQLVREVEPGTYDADGRQVALRPSQITNNLRIARQLAAADANMQAALRAASIERPATVTAARSATPAPQKNSAAPTTTTQRAASMTAPQGAIGAPKLGAGTGFADPENGNRKNARTDSSGRMYWRDSRGVIRYDF